MDPSAFTPFRAEDIVLDDLPVPLHPKSTLPLLPTIVPAAPRSSKRPQVVSSPIRLWREHRKESLPARLQQQGINRDSQEQQQPGRSSKARLLRMQPVYVVKNGNCC
ncbi:hypothetical protein FRC19_007303 [Serendipita sp. 401]|nr:hypothetical protein FRC19_007303 [Serendipita sp. 401]KAG8837550.1 hypothetical protein FRC18_008995 [Serendipita sp. 400]KAG9052826.1 hypothetical protein FS842_009182 [Serendipita sp. 407]